MTEKVMSSQKPWSPKIEGQRLLNPFEPADGDKGYGSLELRDPAQDTGPLQGTGDISSADSLEDVIADAEAKVHVTGEAPDSGSDR
jgi:hypothetical protein